MRTLHPSLIPAGQGLSDFAPSASLFLRPRVNERPNQSMHQTNQSMIQ